MFEDKKNLLLFLKWLKIFLAIFFIFLIIILSAFFIFEKKYENKIYPNVYIGNINLGGKTTDEALKIINQEVDKLNQNGIVFKLDYFQETFMPTVASIEGDLTYKAILIDTESTINKSFDFARKEKTFKENLKLKINNLFEKTSFDIIGKLEDDKIKEFLITNFSRFASPASSAELIYQPKTKEKEAYFDVSEEKHGKNIDYDQAIKKLRENINNLDYSAIELQQIEEEPKIFKKDCANIDSLAKEIISLTPIKLKHEKDSWELNEEKLITLLGLAMGKENKIIVNLNTEKLNSYLEELAKEINIEPTEAKFEITEEGKINEFQISKDGLKLNIDKSSEEIRKEILENKKKEIELYVQIVKSDITTDKLDELGIKEIIGTGESKYTGSPKNRRHNIRTGANAINGLLIKPDEEFSLINALGKIDKESGYLPELVIKDNKTIPEYGGGLCQIGTTLFRTVLKAGLPVTLRKNHSYRVSYYEPAGTDATIYDPWPDFRFINNTGKHILIQTNINKEENHIWFDFWGTSDGRVASTTYPTIYNIVKPAPTKIIETEDLKPGEKKCTEHAHNGADAYFDYSVVYSNGDKKEERFKSHYTPWREVCLVGVEKKETASSSVEVKD